MKIQQATAERFGLSPSIMRDLLQTFGQWPEIQRVFLFGSRARGDFQAGADIDLAVEAPELSRNGFARLWDVVDELPIAYKIDLLHLDTLEDERLKGVIQHEGQVIYAAATTPE